MPSARAFRRMLMSFDTSTTSRCGYFSCSARTTPRIWLSALPMGRSEGRVLWIAVVWNIRRPVASLLPSADSSRPSSSCLASCTSASSERLTWRALRATSDMPFFWWSSSSSVIIGRKMSCSSKRNSELGSCSSTLVSSTNSLRGAFCARALARLAGAALDGALGAGGRRRGAGGGTWRAGAGIWDLPRAAGRPCRPARAGPAGRRRPRQERLACWTAQRRSWCCGPAPGVLARGKVRIAAGRVGNFGSGI